MKTKRPIKNLYKIEFEKGFHRLFGISLFLDDKDRITIHIEWRWFKYAYLYEFIYFKNRELI